MSLLFVEVCFSGEVNVFDKLVKFMIGSYIGIWFWYKLYLEERGKFLG